jgi:hypothetical protein
VPSDYSILGNSAKTFGTMTPSRIEFNVLNSFNTSLILLKILLLSVMLQIVVLLNVVLLNVMLLIVVL